MTTPGAVRERRAGPGGNVEKENVLKEHNPNTAPAPEAIKRNILGADIQGAGQLLPFGGEIWAYPKAGAAIAQKVCAVNGDAMLLIFSGADKVRICQMLGIRLPEVKG